MGTSPSQNQISYDEFHGEERRKCPLAGYVRRCFCNKSLTSFTHSKRTKSITRDCDLIQRLQDRISKRLIYVERIIFQSSIKQHQTPINFLSLFTKALLKTCSRRGRRKGLSNINRELTSRY